MRQARPGLSLLLAVAAGGALGGVLRWWLGDLVPDREGFPWTTFAINVSGSLVLAALPAVAAVRTRPTLTAALGPGLLGGYTTLSTYAEQGRALLADGRSGLAAAYVLGTLAACLVAVTLVGHLSSRLAQQEFEDEEGNE
jgi:CrcB protein